jgi:hypothetical protein
MSPLQRLSLPTKRTLEQSMLFRPGYLGFSQEEQHFSHGNTMLCGKETMGQNFLDTLIADNPLNLVVEVVDSIMSGITLNTFNAAIVNITQVVSNIALQIDPLQLTTKFLQTDPLTANMFKQWEQLTGNLSETVLNLGTLPLLIAQGQSVTKAQVLKDAVLALEVISVVISGGTTAAFIGAGAAQLSQGTLGKTTQGKLILGLIGLTAVGVAAYENAGGLASELDDASTPSADDASELTSDSGSTSELDTSPDTAETPSQSQAAVNAVAQKGATQYGTPTITKKAGITNPLTSLLVGAAAGTTAVGVTSGGDIDSTTDAAQSSLGTAGGKAAVITATNSYGATGGLIATALIAGLANGNVPTSISIPTSNGTRTVTTVTTTTGGTTYTFDDGTQITLPPGTILVPNASPNLTLPIMGFMAISFLLITRKNLSKKRRTA